MTPRCARGWFQGGLHRAAGHGHPRRHPRGARAGADSARWFTIACGAGPVRHFEAAYRQRAGELGTDVVPFADLWLLENDALSHERPPFIEPVLRELWQRWAMLLELPPDARRVQLRAADPDLMIAEA
jgi:hypothetical protein